MTVEEDLRSLELGETYELSKKNALTCRQLVRVPNGWVYETDVPDVDGTTTGLTKPFPKTRACCFIPDR